MRSVGDLVSYLKKCGNGVSLTQIVAQHPEIKKSLIQKFIASGIEDDRIVCSGSGRGAKYSASGSTAIEDGAEKAQIVSQAQNEDVEFQKKLDEYILSSSPVSYIILNKISRFGDVHHQPDSIAAKKFLTSGVMTERFTLNYDAALKKNVIIDRVEIKRYNVISIKNDGKYILTYMIAATNQQFSVSFNDYEDLRETLRAFLGV